MLAAAVLAALCAAPPILGKVREALDLPYHTDSPRQRLDVFSPPAAAGDKFPVVVFLHGGTWMAGDKDFFGINRKAGRMLARNGYVAVLANYRLSPLVRHPEHARDVARAFAWARKNAAKHGGDPTRMILVGHSAGGHLAALVATDPAYLSAADRKALRGVVGISGVYRIPNAAQYAKMATAILAFWKQSYPRAMSVASPLLTLASPVLNPFWVVFGVSDEVQKNASPLHHVRKGLPPFLLLYTEYEPPTLDEMAKEFTRALLLCGVPAQVKRFVGCNHRTIMERLHKDTDPVKQGRPGLPGPAHPMSAVGRLAPSPTGAQHVGNARTYLAAWLSARSQGGRVLLRIEDIDSPRIKPHAAAQAMDDLRWLGLDWDGPAEAQSSRLELYREALARLRRQGQAYPCACTRGDIERAASAPHLGQEGPAYPGTCAWRSSGDIPLGTPFCWRFRATESPAFLDRVAGAQRIDLRVESGDFVVWKSPRPPNPDAPAYQLAVVVDDAAQGVTEVVRGDDLIPSTPRQLLLYAALGSTPPTFAHVPLVVGQDGRRLAKRHGDTRLSALREAGVKAEALVGLLAWSCGWLPAPREISPRELLPLFDLATIPRGPFVLAQALLASIGYAVG